MGPGAPATGVFNTATPPTNVPGNGDRIKISSAFAGNILQITEGHATNAGVNTGNESIQVGDTNAPVSVNDMDLQVNTTSLTELATIIVTNSVVRDTSGNLALNINDGPFGGNGGLGNDFIRLGGNGAAGDPLGFGGGPLLMANSQGSVLAAAGQGGGNVNVVAAENVIALAMLIDGGGPASSAFGTTPGFGNIDVFFQNFGSYM
jgi:hypothetical protein